jgi:uncharacterized RDD family membrane protein YckC
VTEQVQEGTQDTLLGQYAGFVTRLIAWSIDRAILAAAIIATIAAVRFLLQAFPINEWLGLGDMLTQIMTLSGAVVVATTIPVIYNIVFWLLAGQTIGKWVMGVRIVKTNGQRMSLGICIRRQIGYFISAVLFLGYLWILVDNRRQGFHDKLAGTFVLYAWPEEGAPRPMRERVGRPNFQRGTPQLPGEQTEA